MKLPRNLHFLSVGETLEHAAITGVSLHCHTHHSKEILDFVPHYAERIPIAKWMWRREMRRSVREHGRPPRFDVGYWMPPLTGTEVFAMECEQLNALGLAGLVSITDHDSIAAPLEVRRVEESTSAPISMEWTVPFGEAFFHVGVHNLPEAVAADLSETLISYTNAAGEPDDRRLAELFAMLCEYPNLLIVLNHPIWDIEMIGQRRHENALNRFLMRHAQWIHAIEINGFRTWAENQVAIKLADRLGLPIVSGGDRHCCRSNTMINTTNAANFDEFVAEVRVDGYSRIAITPEYHVPLPIRQLASISEILGEYPQFAVGRRRWTDRIMVDASDEQGLVSLTELWSGREPMWARAALWMLGVLSHPLMNPVISQTIGDRDIGRDDRPSDGGLIINERPFVVS